MGLFIQQLKTLIWKNIKVKRFEKINDIINEDNIINYEEYNFGKVESVKPVDIKEFFQHNINAQIGFVIPDTDKNVKRANFVENLKNNDIFSSNYNAIQIETFLDKNSLSDYKEKNSIEFLAEVTFYNYSNYVIRIDGETIVDPNLDPVGSYYKSRKMIDDRDVTYADRYLNTFVPVQLAIDQTIIQSKLDKKININTNIGKLSKPEFNITLIDSEKDDEALTMSTIILPLIFFVVLINLMKSIIVEKEKKQEEGLITIGVHPSTLWLSWEICYIPMYIYKLGTNYPLIQKTLCLFLSPINFSIALGKLNLAKTQNKFISFSNLFDSEFGIYLLIMFLSVVLYHCLNRYSNDYERDPINNGYPLVEVKDIFKLYKNRIKNGKKYVNVLNGVSFNVYNNEIFAILSV
ncbi:hypothetical protein BCR36DRAFT_468857 [Piromyces finnis]|uniref:Uncharacterized protein n=1 Tax=Piromyces finnis TaxID=1754191 RepID=A0A1Y1UV67_9FUNG|nr:hypothetical protein BCR36DRAFT_468857 [Piromyces finnis]|eukprot:ORX41366.1 hypothetical protein BCR36DRAFT_468857 [Piromyces finnis]